MSSTTHAISLMIYFVAVASHGALHAASQTSFDIDFSNSSTFSLADFTPAGGAAFHGGRYDLTPNEYKADLNDRVGRVSYAHPVQLRDKATGEVISFTTAFSFVINVTDTSNKGDGMAFFLGSYPSVLPPNSLGGSLGLCADCKSVNKTATGKDRFVALEFDTYNNTFDPSGYDHMGVDVNSVVSVANVSLPNFSLNGQMRARVDYNSSTRVMNAELRFDSGSTYSPTVSEHMAPRFSTSAPRWTSGPLPEKVAIGFSAATGASVELHQLLSWSFTSISTSSSRSSSTSSGSGMRTTTSTSRLVGLKVALGVTSASSLFLCLAVLALLRALRG